MNYKDYMKKELIPAFGCTEPIALAYAAAKASEVLGEKPEKIKSKLSGNMIKNAHSVKVPGTEGRKGIEISLVAGALYGDASKELQVLENMDKSRLSEADELIKNNMVDMELMPNVSNLYIEVEAIKGDNSATVILEKDHTNIVKIIKNNEVIFEKAKENSEEKKVDFSFEKIYDFAKNEDYSDIKYILDNQINYNLAIAKEGIENSWGSNIGSIILKNSKDDFVEEMVAHASAGSDARMSGCEKPVVINSGSGNQGITVSVPIIMYAQNKNFSKDELYRALIFANLMGLYLKQGIGKLSAYCGVVSASSASVAGIAFLEKEDKEIIKETLSNALAGNSGLICDGAKPSCAMKIASSLRNAFLSYDQAKAGESFESGDGIVMDSLEETMQTVGRIARYGMKSTDEVILNEMLGNTDYIKEFER